MKLSGELCLCMRERKEKTENETGVKKIGGRRWLRKCAALAYAEWMVIDEAMCGWLFEGFSSEK